VLAVVQARMSSRRLPGKILTDLGGVPVLGMVLDRLGRCDELAGVVLATSSESSDDPVEAFAAERGCELHRGPLDDVLARFLGAVDGREADAIVRVTADCPFVEPELIDRLVRIWRRGDFDYVTDVLEPRTFPRGFDAEVVSRGCLELAGAEATEPADREHVTTFIRERPERFTQAGLWMRPAMGEERVTLDTPEDLLQLRGLVERIGHDRSLGEIVAALGGPEEPELREDGP